MKFLFKGLVAVCDKLYDEFDYQDKGLDENVKYRFRVTRDLDGEEVGSWCFTQMPACPGVVISHELFVEQPYRGTGISADMQGLRQHVALELGFSAMLATVQTSNFPEVISSAKAGWKLGPVFRNKRSKHDITFQIKLFDPVKE